MIASVRSEVTERLSRALTFETVSYENRDRIDIAAFRAFRAFLHESFPLVHERLEKEDVGDYGVVFRLPGGNPQLEPALFLAHYDVVPAGDSGRWSHPPFGGVVTDGFIWGRGALDDKGVLMALLEALESRLRDGFSPQRTLYLALGADEEVSGTYGAAQIGRLFEARGLRFCATFDEGMIVARNMLSFVGPPIALIGIAEKGYVDLRVTARADGGHAAMPPPETAATRLAEVLRRLGRRRRRDRLIPVVERFFRSVAPAATPRGLGAILARPRLFAPVLLKLLSTGPTTAALIRTTVAATMLSASEAPNVLPAEASAVLNCRVLPGQTVDELLEEVRAAVGDRSVDVELHAPVAATEAVGESSTDASGYRWLESGIASEFPDAVVAPFLVTGTTDSRHYRRVSRNIYRFVPLELDPEALATIHGVDERIGIATYERAIRFYEHLFGLAGDDDGG